MESGKQGMSPETSSEENNDGVSDLVNGEAGQRSGARRSYECTYCKRGFTNAQALGGHMNIHRKDRAKAKQNTASSRGYFRTQSDRDTPNIPHAISSSPTPFSSHLPNWYHVDNQSNYANFYDQPSSGPSFPYGYSDFESPSTVMSHSLAMNDELMCADLSLQIDSYRYFDRDDNGVGAIPRVLVNEELDLELRLGHR